MPSNVAIPVSALLAIVLFIAASPAVQENHDARAHAAPHVHAPSTDAPARRWAADASLRDGMRRIRSAVGALEHYGHGHMDAAQAANVAGLIDTAVGDIVANCKLAPEADAALHGLLTKFVAGAKALRETREPPIEAIAQMHAALARYPQLFDDPQWGASAD